jgi:WD40 repeat protein
MTPRIAVGFRALALLAVLPLWPASLGQPAAGRPTFQPGLIDTLPGDKSEFQGMTFSPAGHLLATGSQDQPVKLWELPSGRLLCSLGGRGRAASPFAFSPDGRMLATGSRDGTTNFWDVASGVLLRSLPLRPNSVAYSPDGRLFAVSSYSDNFVRIWNARSWRVVATLQGRVTAPTGPDARTSIGMGQVAFAADGRTLASVQTVAHEGEPGWSDDVVQLWDTSTWRMRRRMHRPLPGQKFVAFAPNGRWLAIASEENLRTDVVLWNVATGELRSLISQLEDVASSIAYDPRGRWVAFDSAPGVRFVDVSSGKQFLLVKVGGSQFSTNQVLALSADGRLLAAVRDDGAVKVWRLPVDLEAATPAAAANSPAAAPRAGASP